MKYLLLLIIFMVQEIYCDPIHPTCNILALQAEFAKEKYEGPLDHKSCLDKCMTYCDNKHRLLEECNNICDSLYSR